MMTLMIMIKNVDMKDALTEDDEYAEGINGHKPTLSKLNDNISNTTC